MGYGGDFGSEVVYVCWYVLYCGDSYVFVCVSVC